MLDPNKAKVKETLIYYDGPLLFTCTDEAGQYLTVFAEKEDGPTGRDTWLYVPINSPKGTAVVYAAGEFGQVRRALP